MLAPFLFSYTECTKKFKNYQKKHTQLDAVHLTECSTKQIQSNSLLIQNFNTGQQFTGQIRKCFVSPRSPLMIN